MATQSKTTLKTFFETGDTPTESNFEDLIDSTFNTLTDAEQAVLKSEDVTSLHKHPSSGIVTDDSSFSVINGANVQSNMESIDQALLNARTTGVRYGGDLSVNVDDSNTFDISAAVSQILDTSDPENPIFYSITFSAKVGISPDVEGINYLYYIPGNDNLFQTLTPPTYENRISRIYIGRAVLRGGILVALPNDKDYIQQLGLQLRAVAKAIGQVRIDGIFASANGANLNFNISTGILFDFGSNGQENPHEITITEKIAATFQYVTQTSSITTNRTLIDPLQVDVSGTLITVSNNKFTIQDIYVTSAQNVRIQYGQNQYNSIAEAKLDLGIRPYVVNPNLSLAFRIGFLIVKKETTALNSIASAVFVPANKFGLI